jgi:lysyl-tRNA synthetase class 2
MELKERIIYKNKLTQTCRDYFDNLGFQETNTTNLRLSLDDHGFMVSDKFNKFPISYLRRSHGVTLRTLLNVFERVFEVGNCFRLDEPSERHSPEFLMIEAYTHGANISYYEKLLLNLFDVLEINLPSMPRTISIRAELIKEIGLDIAVAGEEAIYPPFRKKFGHLLKKNDADNLGKLVDRFAEEQIDKESGAVFITDYHKSTTPFAKQIKNSNLIERFEFSVNALEVADCIIFEDNGENLKQRCIDAGVFDSEQTLLYELVSSNEIPHRIGGIGFSVERLCVLATGLPMQKFIFSSNFAPYKF